MKHKSQSSLTISAVAFVAAFLVDLYLITAYSSSIELIIAISLIAVVDTFFLVDGILNTINEIASINIDKQNELTKVEKGIYSVSKREEIARNQSMSALLDTLIELKTENASLHNQLMEQNKLLAKLQIKKDIDNSTKIVNSNDQIALLIEQLATANSKSSSETLEILNDICKELENKDNSYAEYSHLRVMSKAE